MSSCRLPLSYFRHHVRRAALTVLLAILAASAPGCVVIAYFSQAFADSTVKALYILPDRPTLVLVDDPTDQLADPSIPEQIAHRVGANLVQEEILTNTIPPNGLIELRTRLGEDYPRTPIDRIGRELGAEQVIFVYVRSVQLSPEPGLFRPKATVDIKVIDAELGTRLFPPVPEADPTKSQPPPYYRVSISMPYKSAPDHNRATLRMVRQSLGQRIAREVARVFHDHQPREPGKGFDT